MARRRRHQEEHVNHEAWAIPYGDLVTLLLAFFVTMYSMSTVNSGKYRVLSDSLTVAFNGTPRTPQAVVAGTEATSITESLPINEVNRLFFASKPGQMDMPLPKADPRDQAKAEYEQALSQRLQQMEADVTGALGALVKDHTVTVRRHGDNLEVQISTDILFGSGEAQLSPRAVAALRSLAAALKPWPNGVRVEGHTDDRPIHTNQFPSNWELSAARAASVVHLFADNGVGPERMSVVGFAEYAPLQANNTNDGRNANRRVTVTILGRGEMPAGTGTSSTGDPQ